MIEFIRGSLNSNVGYSDDDVLQLLLGGTLVVLVVEDEEARREDYCYPVGNYERSSYVFASSSEHEYYINSENKIDIYGGLS